jgi:hypothetical protein
VVVLFDIKPDAAGRWCCLCLFLVLLGIPRSASASLATSSEVIITGFRGRGGGGSLRELLSRPSVDTHTHFLPHYWFVRGWHSSVSWAEVDTSRVAILLGCPSSELCGSISGPESELGEFWIEGAWSAASAALSIGRAVRARAVS